MAKSYLEQNLPEDLMEEIAAMQACWARLDSGIEDLTWDGYWCSLQATIGAYEADDVISSEQAWYLREKYLRMRRE